MPDRSPRIHGQVEQLIRKSGMEWTFLRPTFFMQNLLGLADMVKTGTIYQPAGDSKAGFVDVADIAAVAVEALISRAIEGQAYDITGPELLSYHDIARVRRNAWQAGRVSRHPAGGGQAADARHGAARVECRWDP